MKAYVTVVKSKTKKLTHCIVQHVNINTDGFSDNIHQTISSFGRGSSLSSYMSGEVLGMKGCRVCGMCNVWFHDGALESPTLRTTESPTVSLTSLLTCTIGWQSKSKIKTVIWRADEKASLNITILTHLIERTANQLNDNRIQNI